MLSAVKYPVLFLAFSSMSLTAQFAAPVWRGSEGSTYAEWDIFTEPKFEPNSPDVSTDDATIVCTTGSAFLTGTGNIYSFQAPTFFQLDDLVDGSVRNVYLQIESLGSSIEVDTARLIYTPTGGETVSVAPRLAAVACEEELTGPNGGIGTVYLLQWDLRENPISDSYTILFNAASSSLSLDKVSLDTSPEYVEIPEPKPLSVEIVDGEVLVSWSCAGQLQSSTTLKSDSWADVVETTGKKSITLPLSPTPVFFRLRAEAEVEPS